MYTCIYGKGVPNVLFGIHVELFGYLATSQNMFVLALATTKIHLK